MRGLRHFILFFVALAPALAFAGEAGELRPAVSFATERMAGSWIGSFFSTLAKGEARPNECESTLAAALEQGGFPRLNLEVSEAQRIEARKFNAVFGRYRDLSGIPNDTAVRAAAIIDRGAAFVVACKVLSDERISKADGKMSICAEACCKSIDAATKRRISTATGKECVPGGSETAGHVAAIQAVCRRMGDELSQKAKDHFSR